MVPKRYGCRAFKVANSIRKQSLSTNNDRDLHREFQGFAPRIQSILSLTQPSEQEKVSKLVEAGVISFDDPITALKVYTDLNNPLLHKYKHNFDITEFLVGCQEVSLSCSISPLFFKLAPSQAFLQVNKAIASQDLFNYANKFTDHSESNDLLRETVNPKIYWACTSACRDIRAQGMQFSMLENKILSVKVVSIDTEIVEATAEEVLSTVRDEAIQAAVGSKFSEPTDPTTPPTSGNISPSEDPVTALVDEAPGPVEPRFPVDSVLATIRVCYNAFEKYEHRTPGGEDVTSERTRISNFTFRGCISDHAELNWMVWKFE